MGKKKSKVSKQKQAKAKHRHASLGGVVVCKGTTNKFQQSSRYYQQQQHHHHQTQSIILHSNSINNNNNQCKNDNNNIIRSNANKKFSNNNQIFPSSSKPITRKVLMNKLSQNRISQPKVFFTPALSNITTSSRVTLLPRLESIPEDQEQQDFQQQLVSLQERQWMAQHKAENGRRKRNKCRSVGTEIGDLSSSNVSSPKTNIFGNMKPASFRVERTTQDLLHETMHQMVHLTGVGISAVETTPIRSNKTILPQSEGYIQYTLSRTSSSNIPPTQISDNRYAVLGKDESSDDDDDYEDSNNHNNDWSLKVQAPLLSFAPASFSLMPRQTPTPVSTPVPTYRQPIELQQTQQQQQQPQHHHQVAAVPLCLVADVVAAKLAANHICENFSEQEIDPDL
jgi:hypothetical protein